MTIPKYKVSSGYDMPSSIEFSEEVGLDIETEGDDTGLVHPAHSKLRLIQIMNERDNTCYIIDKDFDAPRVKHVLATRRWVGHNLHFDVGQLYHHLNILPQGTYDTMVMEGMLDAARKVKLRTHNLAAVTKYHLGRERDKSIRDDFFRGASMTKQMLDYAAEDANDVLEIKAIQERELAHIQPSKDVARLECATVVPTALMSYHGMKVWKSMWVQRAEIREIQLTAIDNKLCELLGGSIRKDMFGVGHHSINFNSHIQVKSRLQKKGIDLPDTRKETIKEAIFDYHDGSEQREILELMTKRSALRAVVSTFGRGWTRWISPTTGRVHGSYYQTRVETGRYSGTNPNLTNIPKDKLFRECFIAEDGSYIIKSDYGQQEARINAFLSGEKVLIDAFHVGVDPYLAVAREMFNNPLLQKDDRERDISKTIFLGLTYGMGIVALAWRLRVSVEEAKQHYNVFKTKFSRLYAYAEAVCRQAERNGYAETVLGRRRFGDPVDPGFTGKMRNLPVQGTAADMMKLSVVGLMKSLKGYDAKLINAVHDETVVEVKKEQAVEVSNLIRETMLKAAAVLVDVPFAVDSDIGYSWGDNSFNEGRKRKPKRRKRVIKKRLKISRRKSNG